MRIPCSKHRICLLRKLKAPQCVWRVHISHCPRVQHLKAFPSISFFCILSCMQFPHGFSKGAYTTCPVYLNSVDKWTTTSTFCLIFWDKSEMLLSWANHWISTDHLVSAQCLCSGHANKSIQLSGLNNKDFLASKFVLGATFFFTLMSNYYFHSSLKIC